MSARPQLYTPRTLASALVVALLSSFFSVPSAHETLLIFASPFLVAGISFYHPSSCGCSVLDLRNFLQFFWLILEWFLAVDDRFGVGFVFCLGGGCKFGCRWSESKLVLDFSGCKFGCCWSKLLISDAIFGGCFLGGFGWDRSSCSGF